MPIINMFCGLYILIQYSFRSRIIITGTKSITELRTVTLVPQVYGRNLPNNQITLFFYTF